MKKKVILSSVLAIVMSLSIAVGATFALFTSDSNVNIAVTSGKVEVVATVKDDFKTYSMGKLQPAGTFENGGTAAIKENADNGEITLELDKVTPGDKIEFQIVVKNNSNVTVQYRTLFKNVEAEDTGLYAGLAYTVGGKVSEFTSNYEKLQPGSEEITLDCSIELPEDKGNEYKDKSCKLIFLVEAIQGNAKTSTAYVTVTGESDEAITSAFANALAGAATTDSAETNATEIALPANANVTFNSGAATAPNGKKKEIKITGDKTTTIIMKNSAPGSEGALSYQDGANLTFRGVTIDSSNISGLCARGGVVSFIDCNFTGELKKTIADKFIFSNCTFEKPVSQVGYGCKDVVFENCKFNTDNGYGIKIYSEGSTPVKLTVKNCEFKNDAAANKPAILLDHIIAGITYNITVENCTFEGFDVTPEANLNIYAARTIVADRIVKAGEQVVFAYQTGVEGGNYHKILTAEELVVTVK